MLSEPGTPLAKRLQDQLSSAEVGRADANLMNAHEHTFFSNLRLAVQSSRLLSLAAVGRKPTSVLPRSSSEHGTQLQPLPLTVIPLLL